jgi:hypothetical protein
MKCCVSVRAQSLKGSLEDYQSKWTLKDYDIYVKACRRIIANIPTYMIFDRHDETDDWNITREWRDRTRSNARARRIISNGLKAYWCFQAWGNDPEMFENNFIREISNNLENMLLNKGTPNSVESSRIDTMLLIRHWSFMAALNPKALCVDIGTC